MEIVMRDGRVFRGSPVEIVRDMQEIAFGVEQLSLSEYIDWVAANAKKFEDVDLRVAGETEQDKAASLVAEMIRTELAAAI